MSNADSDTSGHALDVAQTPTAGNAPKRDWATLATAATAIVAIIATVIYGLGAVALGLKLWYVRDSVTPVLGQLPSSFLLVAAFSYIVFPAILAGAAAYFIYRPLAKRMPFLKSIRHNKPNRGYLIILPILLAAVPAGLVLYFYYVKRSLIIGVEQSWWMVFAACLILSIISIYLALRVLLLVKDYEHKSVLPHSGLRRVLHGAMRVGIAALALVPCVSFVSAAIPLPVVYLCGTTFQHVEPFGHHYQVGNLIGISGQWAYLAETIRKEKNGKPIYTGSYIAVVPLSTVQLAAVGRGGGCGDLISTGESLNSGYYVSRKPHDKPDSPHWFILLAADPNGNISGTIAFVDRYGEPHLSQTFTGHAHSRFAELTFSEAGLRTADYQSSFIRLSDCGKWLKYISDGGKCVFLRSIGGQDIQKN